MRRTATAPILFLAATALAPTVHADGLEFFQTPSGNIACAIGPMPQTAFAGCEIRERVFSLPPRPEPCMGAWGKRFNLHQGAAAQMVCNSDTILAATYPVLEYGQSRSFNPITCESQETGITCTDTRSGHFFRLSRDSYELH